MSSSRAPAFAFSISGFSGAWFSFSAAAAAAPSAAPSSPFLSPSLWSQDLLLSRSLLLDELLELLLDDFFLFLDFFRLLFFFSRPLDRLLLSLPRLFDRLRLRLLFFFVPRPLERLLPLPPPSVALTARDPAWGEKLRWGGAGAEGHGRASLKPDLGNLHLKHSCRFTKLRSPQEAQFQSRLLSSSFPGEALRVSLVLPTATTEEPQEPRLAGTPPPGATTSLPLGHGGSGSSPMGRMFKAVSLPFGSRNNSKVTCCPGMSRV
mmetsp:Transcript_39536/g.104763  ORF Transcript_39536/g.104763 Transcript_39536/m.104763 type:complete len:263 (+) Transcript_39536:302-1090(+)